LINKTPQLICAYGEIEKPNEMPLPPEDEIDELFEK
jgi:hypothetical protein